MNIDKKIVEYYNLMNIVYGKPHMVNYVKSEIPILFTDKEIKFFFEKHNERYFIITDFIGGESEYNDLPILVL